MERVYNFSAGPAVLPVEVLKEAQEEGKRILFEAQLGALRARRMRCARYICS